VNKATLLSVKMLFCFGVVKAMLKQYRKPIKQLKIQIQC